MRESRHRRDRISDKTAVLGLSFFFQKSFKVDVRVPFSMGFFYFLAAENLTFGGGL